MPFTSLPSKPHAQLAYDLWGPDESQATSPSLVVFVNGLGLPAASWKPVISQLQADRLERLHLLIYDRFGQGATTDCDPSDNLPGKEPGFGHDLLDAAQDLHELIQVVAPHYERLVFVAASIGAHIARLYAHKFSGTVSGILILDSNVGNKEFPDFWPDPDAGSFDPNDVVSDDCTLEQYKASRIKFATMFNSDVKNSEGLDRRNVKALLPDPGKPKLIGPDGKGIWLTVTCHDPKTFADEGLARMQVPRSLTLRFTNP